MTGRDTPEVLARVLSAQPPAPPSQHRSDIPPTLEAIVMQCLEREPGARPATAAEVADALRALAH
jgi:serine/threonine-protein kinase